MRKTLAITAATALLALSLAACSADGELKVQTGTDGEAEDLYSTGATDTMRNGGGTLGTGLNGGASTNATATERGLGGVAGAMNGTRGFAAYSGGASWSGRAEKDGEATANNGAAARTERDAQASADRYALMLQNGRVHDTDGFLLDGENTSWRTF